MAPLVGWTGCYWRCGTPTTVVAGILGGVTAGRQPRSLVGLRAQSRGLQLGASLESRPPAVQSHPCGHYCCAARPGCCHMIVAGIASLALVLQLLAADRTCGKRPLVRQLLVAAGRLPPEATACSQGTQLRPPALFLRRCHLSEHFCRSTVRSKLQTGHAQDGLQASVDAAAGRLLRETGRLQPRRTAKATCAGSASARLPTWLDIGKGALHRGTGAKAYPTAAQLTSLVASEWTVMHCSGASRLRAAHLQCRASLWPQLMCCPPPAPAKRLWPTLLLLHFFMFSAVAAHRNAQGGLELDDAPSAAAGRLLLRAVRLQPRRTAEATCAVSARPRFRHHACHY